MSRRAGVCALVVICTLAGGPVLAGSVVKTGTSVRGHGATVITADLAAGAQVGVQVASGFPGTSESFSRMVKRSQPTAAITGTYFCKRTLKPVGDIWLGGQLVNFGGMGTALCVTSGGEIVFRRVPWGRHQDWTAYETVLASGPTLVAGGQVDCDARAEGFTDPHVLGHTSRACVGKTATGKLIMAVLRGGLSLTEAGRCMKELGCTDAMNLDAGASLALYYRGRTLISPGRRLTNLLLVYEAPTDRQRLYVSGASEELRREYADSAWGHYQHGEDLRKQGELAEAIDELRQAAELAPDNASFWRALAETCLKAGDTQQAAAAYARTGRAYLTKQMHNEAQVNFERALELDRGNQVALEGRTTCLRARGMLAEAQTADQNADEANFAAAAEAAPLQPQPTPTPAPFTRLAGTTEGRVYTEANLGLRLELPDGWVWKDSANLLEIRMRHATLPYYGKLEVVPVREDTTPREFEQDFAAEAFKRKALDRDTTVSGRPGYEVVYDEIIRNRPAGSRYLFVEKGGLMFVLAMATYVENYEAAGDDFSAIFSTIDLGF